MKKIILHIGMLKTGTTSLQCFFALNKFLLADLGINFPYFGRYKRLASSNEFSSRKRNAMFLSRYGQLCISVPVHKVDKKTVLNDIDRFKKLIVHSQNKTLLLSDEALYGIGARHSSFWPHIKNFLLGCGIEQIIIIVYLRQQDEYLYSSWKQAVWGAMEQNSFAKYLSLDYTTPLLDYNLQISFLEECFGINNLIVRRYEKASFVNGDIYHDFCDAIGITWNDKFILPKYELNPSLTCDSAEIKRLITISLAKKYGNPYVGEKLFNQKIKKYSFIHPETEIFALLSESETTNLLAKYEAGNRRIALCYFNEESLFPNGASKKKVWKRESEVLLEKTVDFLTQALVAEHARVKKIERQVGISIFRKIVRSLTKFVQTFNVNVRATFRHAPDIPPNNGYCTKKMRKKH